MKADNAASVEQLGRLSKRLNNRMDTFAQAQSGTPTSAGIPVIDGTVTPTFTTGKKAKRNTVRVTLGFASFGSATDIKIVIVYRSDISSADDYDQKRFKAFLADKIDANALAAQEIVTQIDIDLLRGETVDIMRMVAIDSTGGERASNPQTDTDYASYPGNVIYSFATPTDLGVLPSGGPNIIIGGGMMNSLDQFNVLDGGASVAADQNYLGRKWETDVNSGTRISRLIGASWATNGLRWLDTYAVIAMSWQASSLLGRPSTRIQKRIIAGETYTFSCLMAAEDAVSDAHIAVALSEQGVGDIVLEVTADPWTFSIWPVWELLVAVLRVPDDFVMANKHWVTMRLTHDLSGGNSAFTTKWKLERGENGSAWTPHQGDEDQLDAQSNITNAIGHGGFGQISEGIMDKDGTVFGGPDGIRIGKFIR
jgi:hypothetical protein